MTALKRARERFIDAVKAAGGSKVVATRLGCSRSFIDMIRAGHREPGMRTALHIQEAFGIPMQDWVAQADEEASDAHPKA